MSFIFNKFIRGWEFMKGIGVFLKPCRFSIILLIVVLAFLIFADQGQDVLRTLTEIKDDFNVQIFLFFLALWWWAINTWYWARVMLRFDFQDIRHKEKEKYATFRQWIPRILGTLAFIIAAYAFYQTSEDNSSPTYFYFTITCLVFAALFLYATIKRIPILNTMYRNISSSPMGKKIWAKSLVSKLQIDKSDETYKATYQSLKDIPADTWMMLKILAFISITLFILFTLWANTSTYFGSATIVLMAAASWVSFGSILVYWGSSYRFPVITLLFLSAVLFSLWNDNHAIRYLEKETQFTKRISVDKHSKQWFAQFDKNETNDTKTPYFVIAAEGGGIRAAYWTALVLSTFQESNSRFSQHIYGISGVSGGSLGAAAFAAVLNESFDQHLMNKTQKDLKCNFDGQSGDMTKASILQCTMAVLSNDFLSPTVAYMLYPDLMQRFLPFSIPSFDRSRALEGSWESAWKKVFPESEKNDKALFSNNFFDLWSPQNSNIIPNLFLNTTWVETGKRVIASNLQVDRQNFSDSVDFFDELKNDVRLSTAVHNSARFSYVSPPGTVHPHNEEVWGHLVDGGYFENSGATTAYDILTAIIGKGKAQGMTPVVILITNDPAVKEPCDNNKSFDKGCESRQFLNEIYSPIGTMLKTRGARGSYARAEIKSFVEQNEGLYLEFGICKGKGPLPLGWSLSYKARKNMNDQLKNYLKLAKEDVDKFDSLNYEKLKKLKGVLEKSCDIKREVLKGLNHKKD